MNNEYKAKVYENALRNIERLHEMESYLRELVEVALLKGDKTYLTKHMESMSLPMKPVERTRIKLFEPVLRSVQYTTDNHDAHQIAMVALIHAQDPIQQASDYREILDNVHDTTDDAATKELCLTAMKDAEPFDIPELITHYHDELVHLAKASKEKGVQELVHVPPVSFIQYPSPYVKGGE